MIKPKPITRFYVELFTKSDKYLALQKSNWHLKAIVVHVTTSHKWKSMAGICSCQMGEKQRSISFGRWCKIIILWNKCIFFSSFYNLKVWQKKNMLKIVPRRRVYLCSDWLAIDFFSRKQVLSYQKSGEKIKPNLSQIKSPEGKKQSSDVVEW